MTIDARHCRTCLCLLPVLAAVGCSNANLIGISAQVDDSRPSSAELTNARQPRAAKLLSATVIRGQADEYPAMHRPSLGDVDGDGLDDFIIEAGQLAVDTYHNRAYLFYGRTEFPAQLSTADADAVLEAGQLPAVSLGDVNGDGLADFSLGDFDGFEIIFGSSTRLTDQPERFSSGLAWRPADPYASSLYVRSLGDVDGDGMADLRVTVVSQTPEEEVSNRTSEMITDYLVSGRQGAWPSGSWDPTWSIAMLGDEPPAFENDGATTVLQRLVVSGAGDLDGDGYTDLLALGRWRMWVFYGSESGFRGTLTPEQADASLNWPHDPAGRRGDFAKTIPIIVGDVNSDGAVDLGLPNQSELGIVYGTKQRWSGRMELQPDLTVVRETTEFAERNWWLPLADDISYGIPLPELVSTQIRVGVADLDGDAQRELVLHERSFPTERSFEEPITSALYVLSGPNKSATGRYVLSDSDLYTAPGISDASAALSSGQLLDPGGDFDGDGSTDLIFGLLEDPAVQDSRVSLHLLPGAPHAPD